jgi:hypothetical protein
MLWPKSSENLNIMELWSFQAKDIAAETETNFKPKRLFSFFLFYVN